MDEYTLLSIQVYGLAIVISLIVAVVIRGVVKALSALEGKVDAAAALADSVAMEREKENHDHVVAAIAAAVWAVVGPHRIVYIEPMGHGRGWTTQGRIAHHASHAVEHRPKHWNTRTE